MFGHRILVLYTFIVCILYSSHSETHNNDRSVCLLQDPPNQCGEFCLSVLEPLLSHIAKHQEQWSASDALKGNETQAKLDRIQTTVESQSTSLGETLEKVLAHDFKERLARMEAQQADKHNTTGSELKELISLVKEQKPMQEALRNLVPENLAESLSSLQETVKKIPKDFQQDLNRTEQHQTDLNNKMESLQQALETKMESFHPSLDEMKKKISEDFEGRLANIEKQQKAIQNRMEAQQAELEKSLSRILFKVTFPNFKLIGSRYFYIARSENLRWDNAAKTCREMGGYLASFKDQTELDAIVKRLDNERYWLSINDRENHGDYVTDATGKSAQFLRWHSGEPNNAENNEHCVELREGAMNDIPCYMELRFICQAGDEV
ncbi:C-type lectin domain family 4 member K [Drosophila ficusphila]|uniref:C-type lectin domain family 4 member K n=1 Tax=Drosophila ficusphila TaxID=30025 RepID=UPI0007E87F74|nr:C-type lectin domain family 4 member K [Drosophila ficusphila]